MQPKHKIERKEWTAPEAVSYGTVSEITRQVVVKSKAIGGGDDFATNISTYV